MSEFVHLHVHSEYSLLDGMCRITDLVQAAREQGAKALALTDHGNLYGAVPFYKACRSVGIKPIIGCEVYVAPEDHRLKKAIPGKDSAAHFLLLVKNETGYRNLVKLVSRAHLEGTFGGKPRVDHALLAEHAEGLVATSACIKSDLAQAVLARDDQESDRLIGLYRQMFAAGDFYLEVQNHGLPAQAELKQRYVQLASRYGLKLVATNDVHYVKAGHAAAHDILLCIGTGAKLIDKKRMRYPCNEFYLKTPQEMDALFPDLPEALEHTVEIAEKCDFEMIFGESKYPVFQPPEGYSRESYFEKICREGLVERYGARAQDPELVQRLEFEMSVIQKMGFVSYFLITWDFIRFAKSRNIPVGPGRGSAAGSLVAYVMKITDLDPIRYGLLFERFLNPERVSPPDIDIDFCQNRRGEVIQYVREKYGEESVAQIITFGTLGAKMAIRDVARVMGLSFAEASRIANLIPKDPKITIQKAIESSSEFQKLLEEDETAAEVVQNALALEGVARQTGTHAAGVVIGDGSLTQYVPLTKDADGNVITQYSMEPLTDLGMLKMDFLGLKTLTVIQDCLDLVAQTHGRAPRPEEIPLDDPNTFALLNRADNVGVFQVESPGMRKTCLKFNITCIEDIIALIALYRPGPMELIDDYIDRKKGLVAFEYPHPLLEEVSRETYGVMIYQEQVMAAARVLAGYSLGDADLLRRAMGKKKKEEMEKQCRRFVEGCARLNHIPEQQARAIFSLLEKFAGYGFNKSHSAAYALLAYQTAYLKANYPTEFMAALMSNELDNTSKISLLITEARRFKIKVLPPCVNRSELRFTVQPGEIRFGLAAIKNVGEGVVQALLTARKSGGPFTSLEDFCQRVDYRALNRKTIEPLIRCGAFDSVCSNRAALWARIDGALSAAASLNRDKESGQTSLFSLMDEPPTTRQAVMQSEDSLEDWSLLEKLASEKELLGFYVTGHPADPFESYLVLFRQIALGEIEEVKHDQILRIAGVVVSKEVRTTQKDARPYARVQIEDPTGGMEVMVFPNDYAKVGTLLEEGAPLVITGRVSCENEGEPPRLRAFEVLSLTEAWQNLPTGVMLHLSREKCQNGFWEHLKGILADHSGSVPVTLLIPHPSGRLAYLRLHQRFACKPQAGMIDALKQLDGIGEVALDLKSAERRRGRPMPRS